MLPPAVKNLSLLEPTSQSPSLWLHQPVWTKIYLIGGCTDNIRDPVHFIKSNRIKLFPDNWTRPYPGLLTQIYPTHGIQLVRIEKQQYFFNLIASAECCPAALFQVNWSLWGHVNLVEHLQAAQKNLFSTCQTKLLGFILSWIPCVVDVTFLDSLLLTLPMVHRRITGLEKDYFQVARKLLEENKG